MLFCMDPETAHKVTLAGLRATEPLLPAMMGKPVEDPVTVMGLKFPNRVGLAAGMDKEANTVAAFGHLGFGFVEVGTLTPRPQPGNPKPRLFRCIPQQAIINHMGINNPGVDEGVENIRRTRRFKGVLGVNISKNKVTPNSEAHQDYLACLRAVWDVADYVAINFSCPNVPNLQDLAKATNYSCSYISSIFADVAGVTFKEYLETYRINKVIACISETGCSYANAASNCGFNSIRTFNNAFKRVTGTTPSGFFDSTK